MAAIPQTLNAANLFSLAGKTAVVMGGTRGLGAEMTIALASAGADIVSLERPSGHHSGTTAKVVRSYGRKFIKNDCDFGDMKQVRATYSQMWSDGIQAISC